MLSDRDIELIRSAAHGDPFSVLGLRRECGVWEIFLPGVAQGAPCKYETRAHDGRLLPLKAEPYALQILEWKA